jgi:hypothetical protein
MSNYNTKKKRDPRRKKVEYRFIKIYGKFPNALELEQFLKWRKADNKW